MWGTPAAKDAMATAAQFLRGGDAVIVDLRRNGGGDAAAVSALASYFLPPDTELMRFESRGNPGTVSKTSAVPFTLADRPVYVLTSKGTFSAAEEFSDHVSAFKFGTLIGENTGGGGFNNTFVPLPGGYVMSISYGRAVHMVTGKDWEQVGIAPAIAVAADQALLRAQAEAMTALAAKAPEDERDTDARLAAFYRAQLTPVDPGMPMAA
jgi:C-terminal processing protease CtpA/Prc